MDRIVSTRAAAGDRLSLTRWRLQKTLDDNHRPNRMMGDDARKQAPHTLASPLEIALEIVHQISIAERLIYNPCDCGHAY
jgi:hypothetical protein